MKRFVKLVQNVVVNHTNFADDIPFDGEEWIEHDEAQIGWVRGADRILVAPPPPIPVPPTPEQLRAETFRADSGRVDLLQRLRTATPEQIDTWVENNVTTLAQLRGVLKALLKLIALDGRG